MKAVILMPIETSSRELMGKVMLAHRFAGAGSTVYLGSKAETLAWSKCTPGAIFFDKGYHEGVSEGIYRLLKTRGLKIASLDEENAVDFKDFQQLNLRFPDRILNFFDLIFLWGQKQYAYLETNRKNFSVENTFVTGHPRFELLSRKFRHLYEAEVKALNKKYGDFILVNTNFGLGNNVKGSKFVFKNYGKRFPQLPQLFRYQEGQVKNFIELVQFLAVNLQKNIVLRPHPEECHQKYLAALKDNDNVFVVNDGSVIPWIIASSKMIHHDCTTAIEAVMLQKNPLAYTNGLDQDLVTDIPLRIGYKYEKKEQLLKHLLDNNSKPLQQNLELLDKYFSFRFDTTDEIVIKVLSLGSTTKINALKIVFFQISNIARYIKNLFNPADRLFLKKIEDLSYSNIEKYLKSFNSIYGTNVRVKRVSKRLFRIH